MTCPLDSHDARGIRGAADVQAPPGVTMITFTTAPSMVGTGRRERFRPAGFAAFTVSENRAHLLEAAAVLQNGICLVAPAGLGVRDPLVVGPEGFVSVNTLHANSHSLDHHLGADHLATWSLLSSSMLGVLGLLSRVRRLRRTRHVCEDRPSEAPSASSGWNSDAA